MTFTADQIEDQLREFVREGDRALEEFEKAALFTVECRREYTRVHAPVMIATIGPQYVREAEASLAALDEKYELDKAIAMETVMKKAQEHAEKKLSAYQTIAGIRRLELKCHVYGPRLGNEPFEEGDKRGIYR